MTLASIKEGDIVAVDKRGRVFHALVLKPRRQGELSISPFDTRITYFTATAREVVGLWHATKATKRQMGLDA